MTDPHSCPRCSAELVPTGDGDFQCIGCSGRFVREAAVDERWLTPPGTAEVKPVGCPACGTEMQVSMLGTTELDRCPDCHGIWLDAEETLELNERRGLQQLLLYSLSLPERMVRSSVGIAAGAAMETVGLLIPQSFQSAKTYELVVKNSLGFLAQDVGGVISDAGESPKNEDFMARKAVGNFVDLAGMATLHVSPVWLLAIVSDVAYGTSGYVQELARELQDQGIIDDSSSIHHVDDVLTAIQDSSGNVATLFDTPPLSVDQLKATLDGTRESITTVDYSRILPESELRQYWNEMQEISATHGVSLLGVSGALAMNTLGKLETAAKGTLTGVRVVGGLFNQHVIGHYTSSLRNIQENGLFESLCEISGPYVEAVWNNFSHDRPTWTEDFLTGRLTVKGWRKVTGLFGEGKPE